MSLHICQDRVFHFGCVTSDISDKNSYFQMEYRHLYEFLTANQLAYHFYKVV